MIVTILGGSAFSTPSLVDWLAHQHLERPLTIRLAGRTREHLSAVARASRLLAEGRPLRIEIFPKDGWEEALNSTDVTLIQLRVGGLEGRDFDETFPHAFGIPGDEGLGPGGLSSALRSWPVLRRVLSSVQRVAPKTLPLLLTSPAGLLVRLAAREFPDFPVYAICELPFTTLKTICSASIKEVHRVTFNYSGINHLGWLHGIFYEGIDLIAAYREQQKCSCFYRYIEKYQAVPMKYFQLHTDPQKMVGIQRKNPSRARQLAKLQRSAIETFQHANAYEIRESLRLRPAPWYSDAVGPLLVRFLDLTSNRSFDQPFFLSTADSTGNVEEKAFTFHNRQFQLLPTLEAPVAVRRINNCYIEYEQQAAMSLENPTPATLATALKVHPWISRESDADGLAEAMWINFQQFAPKEKQTSWTN
jgi:6-phospho-beta-glucosidase